MEMSYVDEYFEVNGIKEYIMYYPQPGSDIVLIHLHGGPGEAESVFTYAHLPVVLNTTLVYYDQRGAGKTQLASKTDPSDVTIDNLVEDLKATIEHVKERLGLHKVILVGHSFGTVLAHRYLAKYPKSVVALISVGQVVSIVKGEELNMEELSKKIKSEGLPEHKAIIEELEKVNYPHLKDPEEFFQYLLKLRKVFFVYRPSYSTRPSKFKLMFHSPNFKLRDRKWVYNFKLQLQNNGNLLSDLYQFALTPGAEYNIPVFFVAGENDFITPTALIKEYYESIKAPLKGFYSIPFAAHCPKDDNTKEYWNVINSIVFKVFNEGRSDSNPREIIDEPEVVKSEEVEKDSSLVEPNN